MATTEPWERVREESREEPVRGRTLVVGTDRQGREASVRLIKALGSSQRLRILDFLQVRVANVSEIADALEMPLSTANLHINILEEAGLIQTELVSASRGVQKICARIYDRVVVHLPRFHSMAGKTASFQMPVGAYVDCAVRPTCGLAGVNGLIGQFDDPPSFYEPERFHAQIVWLRQGFLEYRFPCRIETGTRVQQLALSMEICSEAPLHHQDWPSDIFLEINGVDVGTWTSPGDFGGARGILSPAWWEDWNSQYGLLKTWRVNDGGAWIDDLRLSDVTVEDLKLDRKPFIQVRIGVREDAANMGGLNLFGAHFGNFPQDIVLRLTYE